MRACTPHTDYLCGLQPCALIHTSRSSVHGRCVLFFVHRAQAHLLVTIFAVSFNQLSSVLHVALVIQQGTALSA